MRSAVADIDVKGRRAPYVLQQLKDAYAFNNYGATSPEPCVDYTADFFGIASEAVVSEQIQVCFEERYVEVPSQKSAESGLTVSVTPIDGNDAWRESLQARR